MNNITEKKTRSKSASLRGIEVQQGEEAAKELADLGIPLPQPGTKEIEVKSKKADFAVGFAFKTIEKLMKDSKNARETGGKQRAGGDFM